MRLEKISSIRDFTFHPGKTLCEVICARSMVPDELASETGFPAQYVSDVLNGFASITADFAAKLEYALGVGEQLWLTLQERYTYSATYSAALSGAALDNAALTGAAIRELQSKHARYVTFTCLSENAKQAIAKAELLEYSEILSKITLIPEDNYTVELLATRAQDIFNHFYPFEDAMKDNNWILALHELVDTVISLPFWHEIIYNNLVRVFDTHLNTNMRCMVSHMMEAGKTISPFEYSVFCKNVIMGAVGLQKWLDGQGKKADICEYAITVLREAYRTDMHAVWLAGENNLSRDVRNTFPRSYLKDGKEQDVLTKAYTGPSIDVKDTCLVSQPHRDTSAALAYYNVKNDGFKQEMSNYRITYFPEANMCITDNGCHHTAMASLLQSGTITPTSVCELSQLFPYIRTNGWYWFDIESGAAIGEVYDYRAATIYELLRLKSLPGTDFGSLSFSQMFEYREADTTLPPQGFPGRYVFKYTHIPGSRKWEGEAAALWVKTTGNAPCFGFSYLPVTLDVRMDTLGKTRELFHEFSYSVSCKRTKTGLLKLREIEEVEVEVNIGPNHHDARIWLMKGSAETLLSQQAVGVQTLETVYRTGQWRKEDLAASTAVPHGTEECLDTDELQ